MAKEDIVPYQFTSNQNRSQAAAAGRKGGVASGAARRAKKEARETAKLVLDYKPDIPAQMLETLRRMGMKKNVSPDMRLIATLAIMQKAMKGDTTCYKYVVDLAGESAEAAMIGAKADEVIKRTQGGYDEPDEQQGMTGDYVRQRMSEMTDDELMQYERMCQMFETEQPNSTEDGGGSDE